MPRTPTLTMIPRGRGEPATSSIVCTGQSYLRCQHPKRQDYRSPSNVGEYSRETMQKKIQTGEIFFSEDEARLIRKIYLADQEGMFPNSVWLAEE